MTKKQDDDSTPTEMMRDLADKLDVSEKSKKAFIERFKDSSKAGQDYKSARAYVWAGIKEIFLPGVTIEETIRWVNENVKPVK